MNDARIPDPAALLREAITGEARALPWTLPDAAALAAAFPELAIHELVGQGGMAAVYRATQARLGRQVALKVMRQDLAAQPQFAERFVREAKALAALANPHVLTIHDFGERAGFCYLVTEYVDGANLRELMGMGQLSPTEVLRIVPQICAGLHFAHQHGVVHRDIKPENVLVDRQGQVKLADFGLAKLVGEAGPTLTQSHSVFGTPHYMAPEQWRGAGAVDHRADIYSLGVVLYELLTGRLPVGTYAPASQQPGVPSGIDQVVQRSLQQEPDRRYQSARDVQRDLEQQRTAPPGAAPHTPQAVGAPRSVLGWLVAAAVTLAVGAASVAGYIVWQGGLLWAHMRKLAEIERYELHLQELCAAVASGRAWNGRAVEMPTPGHEHWLLPGTHRGPLMLVFALGVVVLFLVFASLARARSADVSVPRWQHTAAGFCVWLPAFALGMTPLLMLAEHYANASNGVVPILVVVVKLAVGVLLLRVLHAAGAHRVAVPVPRFGVARACCAAFAACLLVACPVLVVIGADRVGHTRSWGLVSTRKLDRLPAATVLGYMGPPLAITMESDGMRWKYANVDGTAYELRLRGGLVERSMGPAVQLVAGPRPAGRPYLGQSGSEVVALPGFDRLVERAEDGSSTVHFVGGTAAVVRDGIVVELK